MISRLLIEKLRTLSLINRLVKYADDMTLVVPQHTDCSIDAELQNIVNWSEINKQNINTNKTKEIIFWRSGRPPKVTTVPTIPQIELVQQVRLLGVLLSSNLSFTPHIKYILAVTSQRFYLLNQLKKCPSLLLVSTVYLGHWLFHVLYMLYQLFMGLFYRATLIASMPCLEKPSDGVLYCNW